VAGHLGGPLAAEQARARKGASSPFERSSTEFVHVGHAASQSGPNMTWWMISWRLPPNSAASLASSHRSRDTTSGKGITTSWAAVRLRARFLAGETSQRRETNRQALPVARLSLVAILMGACSMVARLHHHPEAS
jgi:hypothetical protein